MFFMPKKKETGKGIDKTPVLITPAHPARPLIFWLLIIGLVFILSIATVVGYFGIKVGNYLQAFTAEAHVSNQELISLAREGWNTQAKMDDGRVNILLLGTDELANRTGDPIFTDTLMVLSLNTQSGELSALSLPRDLWIPEYQTKVNSLYWYGNERTPDSPELFTTQVLSELMDVPIHYSIVLSLDTVAEVIDAVGGLDIFIQKEFTDERFPRTDVDIRTETDPAKLYETVEFKKGIEKMTGERALKYMRSRKSQDLEVGTDDARNQRQQEIISALIQKIKDPELVKQPQTLGKLFSIYNQDLNSFFPMTHGISLAKLMGNKLYTLEFTPSTIPIKTPISEGVITHPPVPKYDQWVYEVVEITAFRNEVKKRLRITAE